MKLRASIQDRLRRAIVFQKVGHNSVSSTLLIPRCYTLYLSLKSLVWADQTDPKHIYRRLPPFLSNKKALKYS